MDDSNSLNEVKVRLKLEPGEKLLSNTQMSTPEDAVRVMQKYLYNLDREYCTVVNLDTGLKPISFSIAAIGDIDQAVVPIRNLFKTAILQNASSIMMFHNHPSGDVHPSDADFQLTQRVAQCGKLMNIPLLDHIIIGSQSGYGYSFQSNTDIISHPERYLDGNFAKFIINSHTGERSAVYQAVPFSEQVDLTLENKMDRTSSLVVLKHTPELLQKLGCRDLPICYTQKHLQDAMHPNEPEYQNEHTSHYHGLSEEMIKKLPDLIKDPAFIFDSLSKDDSLVLGTDQVDDENHPIVVLIRPNGQASYLGEDYPSNFVTSMYPHDHLDYHLQQAVEEGKLLYINRKKSQKLADKTRFQVLMSLSDTVPVGLIHQSQNLSRPVNIASQLAADVRENRSSYSSRNIKSAKEQITEYRKQIGEQFIRLMDKDNPVDCFSWVKQWHTVSGPDAGPISMTTGKPYRGSNAFVLSMTALMKGYQDPRWTTFSQLSRVSPKAHVNKGEHGTTIQRWLVSDLTKKKGEKGKFIDFPEMARLIRDEGRRSEEFRAFPKFYSVFNAEQCSGIPPLKREKHEAINQDEYVTKISRSMGVPIYNDQYDNAFYRPSEDAIHLPNRDLFISEYAYNAVALHELGHSSGAANRLNRSSLTNTDGFGGETYAFEELVAEMTSAFTSVALKPDEEGMNEFIEKTAVNHYKYVKSWASAIRKDPNCLDKALEQAQLATDFLDLHGGRLSLNDYNRKHGLDNGVFINASGDIQVMSEKQLASVNNAAESVNEIRNFNTLHGRSRGR